MLCNTWWADGRICRRHRLASFKLDFSPSGPMSGYDERSSRLQPDDHSEVEPPLPIPNRTVKHLSADDSGMYFL